MRRSGSRARMKRTEITNKRATREIALGPRRVIAIKHRDDASAARNKLFLVNESMLLPPGAIINDVRAIITGGMAVNYKSFPRSNLADAARDLESKDLSRNNRARARDSLTSPPRHRGDFSEDPIVLPRTPGKTRSPTINLVPRD